MSRRAGAQETRARRRTRAGSGGIQHPPISFGRLNRLGYQLLRAAAFVTIRPYFRLSAERLAPLPPGPAILCPNHCSYADPFVLQAVIPERRIIFMMTRDWYDRPLLGRFFRAMRCIPVDGHGRNREAIERCVSVLCQGHVLGVFPEGRVCPEGAPGRFHTGAVALSARTGAPVVPVAIRGSGRAMPKGAVFPRPHRITVRIGGALEIGERVAREAEARKRLLDEGTALLRRAVMELLERE